MKSEGNKALTTFGRTDEERTGLKTLGAFAGFTGVGISSMSESSTVATEEILLFFFGSRGFDTSLTKEHRTLALKQTSQRLLERDISRVQSSPRGSQ